jgi:GMP reductase
VILDNEVKLDFHDVLIRPKRSTIESRSQVALERKFRTRHGYEFSGVPIIAANMATGTFEMLEVFARHKMFVAIAKHFSPLWDKMLSESSMEVASTYVKYGFYTIGMNDSELETLIKLSENWGAVGSVDDIKICVDIANGYTQKFASFVSKVRSYFPKNVIIAGNVATPEMVQELIIAGADFCKIGIGPGSQCTTRMKTGVGFPQISAAIECSDAAHGLGAGIVLDGGMRYPGDVAKAFVANSDMVMIGGMFSGTDEQDGEKIGRVYMSQEWDIDKHRPVLTHKFYKIWYGMSSDYAQEKHSSGMKEYRASEGRKEEVPYVGPVEPIIMDLLGGLRSAGAYIGAISIKNFGKCGTLVRVSRQHDRF